MDMTQGPIFSKIIVFALPLIFTNLLQMLYNAADMVVVGKFSGVDGAVGAIGSTGALLNLATNIIIGFSTGANVCVANALGVRMRQERRRRLFLHFLGTFWLGWAGHRINGNKTAADLDEGRPGAVGYVGQILPDRLFGRAFFDRTQLCHFYSKRQGRYHDAPDDPLKLRPA